MGISKKSLESGKVLQVLRDQFQNDRNMQTAMPFLSCLRDSILWIPTTVRLSERDEDDLLKHLEIGAEFITKDPMHCKPDILQDGDGVKWFPIFSSQDEVTGEYKDLNFSYIPVEALDCLSMAHSYECDGVKGLVLDPFTKPEIIPFEIADLMIKIESRLDD